MRLAVCAIRRAFAFPLWTHTGHLLNTHGSLTTTHDHSPVEHSQLTHGSLSQATVKQQSSNSQATVKGHTAHLYIDSVLFGGFLSGLYPTV